MAQNAGLLFANLMVSVALSCGASSGLPSPEGSGGENSATVHIPGTTGGGSGSEFGPGAGGAIGVLPTWPAGGRNAFSIGGALMTSGGGSAEGGFAISGGALGIGGISIAAGGTLPALGGSQDAGGSLIAAGGRSAAAGGSIVAEGGTAADGGAPTGPIDLPVVNLPDSCEPTAAWDYYGGCEMQWICENAYLYVSCDEMGDDGVTCSCSSSSDWRSYLLPGVEVANACQYIAAVCLGEVTPEFSDRYECELGIRDAFSDWCYAERQCQRAAEISGVSLNELSWRSTSCNKEFGTTWSCVCSAETAQDYVTFQLPEDVEPTSVCQFVEDRCDVLRTAEPSGPRQCVPSYQDASSSTYCAAQLSCSQPATISGTVLELRQLVPVGCSLRSDAEWDCQCGDIDGQMSFVLPASTSWEACGAATTLCGEALGSGD